jgi:hypothetical protein
MNLPCRALWQFRSEEDSVRNFVVGEPGSQVLSRCTVACGVIWRNSFVAIWRKRGTLNPVR